MVSDQPLVVGLHVPKCAGMTILRHVQKHVPSEFIHQCTALFDNFDQERPEFLTIRLKNNLRFVFGHHLHEEMIKMLRRPTVFFVGLRDPLERITSELNYHNRLYKHIGKEFDAKAFLEWTRNPVCNFLVARFPMTSGSDGSLAERAMRVLECFHYVYFPDTFPELTTEVLRQLRLPPIQKNENVTEFGQTYDIDASHFSEDIALYEEAYKRWGPGASLHGSESADKNIGKILDAPRDLDSLRQFIYKINFYEYRNWNVLEQVIAARKSLIEELNAELKFYENALIDK